MSGSWQFSLKTVGYGAGAGLVGLFAGPLVGVAGAATVLYTRSTMISMSSAFNGKLDHILRSRAASGARFTDVLRFSKGIDRLAPCCDAGGAVQPIQLGGASSPQITQPAMNKQTLPALRHSGIVLCLVDNTGTKDWLKIEFAKEGLDFVISTTPNTPIAYLVEPVALNNVSPVVLADCLQQSKHLTYNAVAWNCNHVADMIWDTLLKNSSQQAARNSANHTSAGLLDFTSDLNSSSITSSSLVQAKVDQDKDGPICKICFDQPRSMAFGPCGHYNTCDECAKQLTHCPFCKKKIEHKQRIFGD